MCDLAQRLKQVFRAQQKDKTKSINRKRLDTLLKSFEHPLTQEEYDALLMATAKNRDVMQYEDLVD